MRMTKWFLQLFAEGESGEAAAAAEAPSADAGRARGRKANPEANTLFGIQPETPTDAASHQEEKKEVQKRLTLEELLKNDPEYKKEYDAKVSKALKWRFKEEQAKIARNERAEQILAKLAPRFNISGDGELDLEALDKAVDDDKEYYEARAMKNGTSAEIERKLDGFNAMKKREEQRKANEQAQAEEARSREEFRKVAEQGEKLKELYPGFDLSKELEDRRFARMLHAGAPVKAAFEGLHHDELVKAGMGYAVQQTAQKVSAAVQSGAKAPTEGVLGNRAAANHVTDPSKLTKAQREEIRARVRRGEKVIW